MNKSKGCVVSVSVNQPVGGGCRGVASMRSVSDEEEGNPGPRSGL